MIKVPEDIFENLERIGFSKYEIRIYEALLLKGSMNSTQIVKETGIPQPRVYDLFSSMQKKGFIESSFGKKKMYKAISIATIMEREQKWIENYRITLERHVRNRKSFNRRNQSTFISMIEGEENITEKMKDLIENTKDELILSVDYERYMILLPLIKHLSAKNATICIIVFLSGSQSLNTEINCNCFIRTMKGKPVLLIISDRESSIMGIESKSRKDEIALYLEEDNFIHVVSYYFNQSLWKYADIFIDKIERESIRFRTIWLACDIIEFYLLHKYKLNCYLEGYLLEEKVVLEGKIEKVEKIPFVRNTFFIQSKGKKYSVGGKTSSIEDIKMSYLEIRAHLLQE